MIRDHARLHLPGFLVQVLATAVGLMLALGLDQWRDHRRQAELAQAHLAAIQAELRSNDQEIEVELKGFVSLNAALLDMAKALRREGRIDLNQHLSYSIASLRQSAWDMAVSGQTPLRADLARMTRLASVYESLRILRGMQDRLLDQLGLLGSLDVLLQSGHLPPMETRRALADRVDGLRARIGLLLSLAPSVRNEIAGALAP